jgi:drug/metabolite transporter (DMT)-like permease
MKGYILGGLLPAVCIGMALTSIKYTLKKGVSPQGVIVLTGFGVLCTGLFMFLVRSGENTLSIRGVAGGLLIGVFWASGTFLMSYSVDTFNLPMSVSASLAATNAVIAAVLSIILFQEHTDVSVLPLLSGTVLITLGAMVITRA